MRICEIQIEEFGGISNKKISLESGFNLLCGANESGKTTLCDFIKYIFYGFTNSEERIKKSNFRTGNSSGYIIIEDDNKNKYRIERINSEKSKERIYIFNEPEGTDFLSWKDSAATPGEFFFGVTEKLYTRSIYVSQENGAKLDGGSTEAISNLLISGDEAVNLNKAKNDLDRYRKELRLKKGRGGKICDTEDLLNDLNNKFDQGVKTKESLIEINSEIKQIEEINKEKIKQFNHINKSLTTAKMVKISGLLKEKKDIENDCRYLEDKVKQIKTKNTVNGFLPDEDYIRNLNYTDRDLLSQKGNHDILESKILAIDDPKSVPVPSGYDEYNELGGKILAKEK